MKNKQLRRGYTAKKHRSGAVKNHAYLASKSNMSGLQHKQMYGKSEERDHAKRS